MARTVNQDPALRTRRFLECEGIPWEESGQSTRVELGDAGKSWHEQHTRVNRITLSDQTLQIPPSFSKDYAES